MNVNRRCFMILPDKLLALRGMLLWPVLLLIVLMGLSLASQPVWAGSSVGNGYPGAAREAQPPPLRPLNSSLLAEGFDGVTFPPANWGTTIITGATQGWSRVTFGNPPPTTPHSGAGMAQFDSFLIIPGDSTRLYTPLLNLTGQTTPTLTFWMYHDLGFPSSNDRIQVQISTDSGASYPTTLATLSRYDGSTGWKQHTIGLSAYIGQSNVRLGFLAISAFGNRMFIDDVVVGPPITLSSIYLPIVLKTCPESNNIANAITVSSGQTACGQVSDPTDLDDVYRIAVVAGQQLTISMNGTGGDADLYLYPPGTTNVNTDPYVDFSENIGNNEFIQGTALVGGFWYIDVYAFSGTSNYNVTATLSGLSSAETKTFSLTGIAGNSKGDKNKSPH